VADDVSLGLAPPYIVRMGQFTPTGVATQILAADPNRLVMLLTLASTSGAVVLYLRHPDITGYEFVVMPGIYSDFSYQRHGDIVFEPLWTSSILGGSIVSWMTLSKV
jgi:hypothetical protein